MKCQKSINSALFIFEHTTLTSIACIRFPIKKNEISEKAFSNVATQI